MVDLQTVPRYARPDEIELRTEEECLAKYVAAILATAQVFATSNHKNETLVSYDSYMVWVEAWLVLSGFGSYVVIDPVVSLTALRTRCARAGAGWSVQRLPCARERPILSVVPERVVPELACRRCQGSEAIDAEGRGRQEEGHAPRDARRPHA